MDADAFGEVVGSLILVALVVLLVVRLARRKRRPSAPLPTRDAAADLATLGRGLALHTTAHQSLALVASVVEASNGQLVPAKGPVPVWRIGGGHPVVMLAPTSVGSMLAVVEVIVPLPSPQGPILWEWLLTQVTAGAQRDGVPFTHLQQHFVKSRQIDAHRAVWVSASAA